MVVNPESTPQGHWRPGPDPQLGDWRPVPDPTVLTTLQLYREIAAVREIIETRLDGMDKAQNLLASSLDGMPTLMDKRRDALRELLEEIIKSSCAELNGDLERHVAETTQKFLGVQQQTTETSTRTDQRAGDIKLAVDAAFAAAKEATGKIEAGFVKQIDGLLELVRTKWDGSAEALTTLKERIAALESRSVGAREQVAQTREATTDRREASADMRGWLFGGISALVAISTIGFTIIAFMIKRGV